MCFKEGKTIESIVEAIDIGLRCEDCFCRGEAEKFPLPIPGIFRDKYWAFPESTKDKGLGADNVQAFEETGTEKLRIAEGNFIYKFKRLAPGLISDKELPGEGNPGNNLKWLFLMQHHGMPTRLLDWTENILVALFIAVSGKDDKDSQIWTIQPKKLNKLSQIDGHPLPDKTGITEYMAREMFYSEAVKKEEKDELLEKFKIQTFPNQPIAILPPLAWPRMIAQHSTFTLHPKPISRNDIFPSQAELTRHIIPAKYKLTLRKDLRKLGIKYRTLIPELDSISKDAIQCHEDKKLLASKKNYMDNKLDHKRYVAHFDMLGFKSVIARDLDEAWGALCDLRSSMDKILRMAIGDISTGQVIADRIRAHIFSDSILIFTLSNKPEDLKAILILSSQLFSKSLESCVPLRGGISVGKFYFNEDLNLFCGTPFVQAYQIAESAQWSGIVVHDSVAKNYFKEPSRLTSCDSPEWRSCPCTMGCPY
ncbi:MAG: FRG domain-containing protein [Planctomycetes bacterium]|nr:FRG domain-containing protein [Planctomycetota bacterium]